MESLKTDVLIIGAGPAGAAAAIRLSQANVNVTLVDKSHFPRAKVCGDGLTPKAVAVLQGLGVDAASLPDARRFGRVSLVGPDNSVGTITLKRLKTIAYGAVVSRRVLDHAVMERAISLGARFMPGLRITQPIIEAGFVRGARGELQTQAIEVRARLTIAADGAAGGFTARLAPKRSPTVREVAMRTYFADVSLCRDEIQLYFDRRLLPAYGWLFPLANGIANVGVGLEERALKRTSLSSAFHTFVQKHPLLREHLQGGTMMESPRGFPLRSAFHWKTSFAPGVLLVGDAAGLVHPFTGEGIRFALESGELAARHALDAISVGDVSAANLRRYGEALQARYGAMHRTSNFLRSVFHWPWIATKLLSAWADPVSASAL